MARRDRDEEDDDDRPRRPPARQREVSLLPWVIVFLTAVALVCGGLGVLFIGGWLVPKLAPSTTAPVVEPNTSVTDENVSRLRAGMTLAQVEQVLGPGRPAQPLDVTYALDGLQTDLLTHNRWSVARQMDLVYAWEERTDRILVGFDTLPTQGGKLTGVVVSIDRTRTYSEPIRLPNPPGVR